MIRLMKCYFVIGLAVMLSCSNNILNAQSLEIKSFDEIIVPGESMDAFDIEAFYKLILANHPIVKQAELLPENAKQELRMAKGAFDPKLQSDWNVKNFKDTEYYDMFNASLKVPTWFPIDPKLSIDRNRGAFLNSENAIPMADDFQQITAGVSLPIGRGLLIDQRRADVKQAVIFNDISEAERIKLINKVLLSAAKDYWTWFYSFYQFKLVTESVVISEEIYRRVKLDYSLGVAAAVDTIQAAITLQNRTTDERAAQIEFLKSGFLVSNYLWGENEEPLELVPSSVPVLPFGNSSIITEDELVGLRVAAIESHPELQKLGLKLNQLDIDERLAKENLKPTVNLDYNLINAPIGSNGGFNDVVLGRNYKFGFQFEFPLFLRKERSKVRQTQIKIEQAELELNQTQREILNEISSGYIELLNTMEMISLQQTAVSNYVLLLRAELFNLENGESDLFKINFQQDKLLESQSKLLKLTSNYEKIRAALFWAAGLPYLRLE
ncbi:MAG: outer membrane protein TolC [Roseivirga sp.]|jgi:outer membrane protein TolC